MNSEAAAQFSSAEPPFASEEPAIPKTSSPPPESAAPAQNPRALLKTLRTQFSVFRDCLPLSIGIDKAIKAALPEVSKKTLRIALSLHTHGNRYLHCMTKATQRFDLEAAPAGEVTEEHRQHAAELLRARMKKQADERRAAQKAERERQKAEQPEPQPQPARHVPQKAERAQPKEEQPKAARKDKAPPKAEQASGVARVHAEKLALLAQKYARH